MIVDEQLQGQMVTHSSRGKFVDRETTQLIEVIAFNDSDNLHNKNTD
jgi:hypothetical protein